MIRDVEKDVSAQHEKKCVIFAGGKHRGVSCGRGAQRVNVLCKRLDLSRNVKNEISDCQNSVSVPPCGTK